MQENILEFTCTGMKNSDKFPIEYTGRGKNISPEFLIKNLDENAKTLVITLEDISHPIKNFTHWIIWNIPAKNKIPQAIPSGRMIADLDNAMQGVAYGFHRYAGAKPPKHTTHYYKFTIYVLDCSLDLKASSTKTKVLRKAKDHVIQKGEFSGYFE
ncbi:MAG: YbhB/YbcL family Raf kinase inhibitor-like protein [Oscillospiraceae bacterium]|nr:YbhB/YbcL family Raf kinase inhibitor-like protein [Oscillospiraceae bacterium]